MQQFYTLRFLSSSEDPRYDGWIGQAYGLSYLNSEPGNNFLFSYKPYEIMHSRVYKGNSMADKLTERPVQNISYVTADKRSRPAATKNSAILSVTPILETIVSRNFQGVLDDVSAFISGVITLTSRTENKEAGSTQAITPAELEERINTYVLPGYTNGRQREWLKETLLHHLVNAEELWTKDGVMKWVDFADLRFFPREALDVGIYLNAFINKLRSGELPRDFIRHGDRTEPFRQKGTKALQPLIGMELSFVPFINTGTYSKLSVRPEKYSGIDQLQWLGGTPEQASYWDAPLTIGTRPDYESILAEGINLGRRRYDHIGIQPAALNISERIDSGGIIQSVYALTENLVHHGHYMHGVELIEILNKGGDQLSGFESFELQDKSGDAIPGLANFELREKSGDAIPATLISELTKKQGEQLPFSQLFKLKKKGAVDLHVHQLYTEIIGKNQFVYPPLRLMDRAKSKQVYFVDELHIYERNQDQARIDTLEIRGEMDITAHAIPYPVDTPLGERHGSNAHISAERTLMEYGRANQANLMYGYITIDGSHSKDSYQYDLSLLFENTTGTHGYVFNLSPLANEHGASAYQMNAGFMQAESSGDAALINKDSVLTEASYSTNGSRIFDNAPMVDTIHKSSMVWHSEIAKTDKIERPGRPFEYEMPLAVDGSYRTDIIDEGKFFVNKIDKAGRLNEQGWVMSDEKITKPTGIDHAYDTVTKLILNAYAHQDVSRKVDKLSKQAWYIHMLNSMDRHGKSAFVVLFWERLQKVAKSTRMVEAYVKASLSDIGNEINPEFPIRVYEGLVHKLTSFGVKDGRDVSWVLQRLMEYEGLDSLFIDLIGGADLDRVWDMAIERIQTADRHTERQMLIDHLKLGENEGKNNHEALPTATVLADIPDKMLHDTILPNVPVAEREEMFGILQQMVIANNESKEQRPGYIPEPMLLVQDQSQWDDIWNRYSPGIDLIDVPNTDFDYGKLASQVYDPETGVPLNPLSPTNVPDVAVPIPLHHPLPQNYDLGTGEVYVDNYIMIDSILAINTLMERSKLRYAGMPAEDAMRELFSKLFAWIQQVSPGNPEYDRMFRFARWYAETCVINLSRHILHRTYTSWMSEMHLGNDLGLPYTATNWQYIDGGRVLRTTGDNAGLSFNLETYIDGNATFRGHLDNPRGAGVLEVYIDGDLKQSITANGSFQVMVECLQGDHIIDFIFSGASGMASLSSMEIQGAKFISAYTSSDDKNTNGLKAMTTLIKMLLSYYDLHHGDGKIKGSKELGQRKLFNWQ